MSITADVIQFDSAQIDKIGRRIREGFIRANKGGEEWIEGSCEAAQALYEGRQLFRRDREFGAWLHGHSFNFYTHQDRAALITMGADLPTMRDVLKNSDSRSYRVLLRDNAARFTNAGKPDDATRIARKKRPGRRPKSEKSLPDTEVRRKVKLGEENYTALKGTSLGSPKEMDALITLMDGQTDFAISIGGETPIAPELISRALAGEPVSAVAVCLEKQRVPLPTLADFTDAWIRHPVKLLSLWTRADNKTKRDFIAYLEHQIDG
jgi:hypothetical protein